VDKRKEFSKSYYNDNIGRAGLPLSKSPWLDVYLKAMDFIGLDNRDKKIIDLGCGTGRFAKLLFINDFDNYVGVDFAYERIKECKKYVPGYEFICEDVFSKEISNKFESYDVFVLLEVLEHIKDDLKLLDLIPKGKDIIFSVPNYLSASHVRAFKDIESIKKRYSFYLDILDNYTRISKKLMTHTDHKGVKCVFHTKIFLLKGVKI
jgi:2-polyprenyl-3-methyl-5-hydroxy-6-metoxy-1,4-benzoquinol methylase